uniref:Dolichyl-diphosphooligosaccharide--protein glycosyltransferase subunit STT3A n=1 Tax=Parastrongyloides trichosuri TaxID=131310 RepID=A0A0N4Z0E6_PARTI
MLSILENKIDTKQQLFLLKLVILTLSCIVAFASRLFAVIRFESIIHEYDPYFNYRTTQYFAEHGFYKFHNWFDDRVWYPLGRNVGGTIFNGLMITSTVIYRILHFLNITIHIREVCVFLAPLYSMLTVLATFGLTKECFNEGAALVAGIFIGIAPGYISRSVAGSYDNEGIAIFCMIFTYYLWIKSVKTGSIYWAVSAALAYYYMVSSWGGYVFLINLIPLHVLFIMITGRFTSKIYTAYSVFYILGILMSMQIPFVGFQPVSTSEHLGAFGVFGLCQLISFAYYLRSKLSPENFSIIVKTLIGTIASVFCLLILLATVLGKVAPFAGRFYSFLDPSYAKKNIPIIASVSEHQPTAWASYYFDLQYLMCIAPVGLYFCFKKVTNENMFLILYAATAVWFSGVMVRMMLILTPIICILGGIGISCTIVPFLKNDEESSDGVKDDKKGAKKDGKKSESNNYKKELSIFAIGFVFFFLVTFAYHCTWVTSEAYSSPSIVLAARGPYGTTIFDDFREAYYWLRKNTPDNARIMSWWDYGYQLASIADSVTIVDNNTWNNTHISRVGQALASNESHAIEIIRELDVDYVLVIFGGYSGYSSDDGNKAVWFFRIGSSTPSGAHINENDYYNSKGEYTMGHDVSDTMKNSVIYKLLYYRFGSIPTGHGVFGYDRTRNVEIGHKNFELEHFEEAFTSEHWIVRIYKVKPMKNKGTTF